MKTVIVIKIAVTSLLAASLLSCGGTGGGGISDTLIITGTSIGVSTYLGHGISDPTRRTAIANLGSGIAGSLRSVTTSPPPTADQLSAVIIANIPENLRTQYPEVVSFVVPLVIQGYTLAIQQYGGTNQQKVYQILNDIATGVETGCAPYVTLH
jgi:hypothetical protein